MIKPTSLTQIILHTDTTGTIWYESSDNPGAVKSSSVEYRRLLDQDWCPTTAVIKVPGFRHNAKLIVELFDAIAGGRYGLSLQVGTPAEAIIAGKLEPCNVVLKVKELELPPSCGGWRQLTVKEAASYRLIAAYDAQASNIERLLQLHPAYPVFSFISAPTQAAVRTVVDIVDPRWFVDPFKPDRTSRLRSYMGMHIDTVGALLSGADLKSNKSARARNLIANWRNIQSPNRNSFLDDVVADTGSMAEAKGVLKASVKLLTFIKDVWLDQTADRGRTLFVPEYFFNNDKDALDFKAHLAKINRTRQH